MSANAPQGGPTKHAQGAHPSPLPTWNAETFDPDSLDPVQQPVTPNLGNDALTNRVQNIDITTIGNDRGDDADYDDPYPANISSKSFNPLVPQS